MHQPGHGRALAGMLAAMIPLALLRLKLMEFVVIAALLIVPLEFTAERFTAGWWALLAYPRLYAAWTLWAAAVRELRAEC